MKKFSSILMTILIVLQTLLPMTAIAEIASEQGNSAITDIKLQKDNQNETSFYNDDYVSIIFNWVNGADSTFEVPKELAIKEPKTGDLISNDQQIVGKYEVAIDGKGKVHFDDPSNLSSGKFVISGVINDQQVGSKKYKFLLNNTEKLVAVTIATKSIESSATEVSDSKVATKEETKQTEQTQSVPEKKALKINTLEVGKKIDFDILTSVVLKDKNGNIIGDKDTPKQSVGDKVTIDFTWALPKEGSDNNVSNGDYYVFELPKQFEIFSNITRELKNSSGTVIGVFTVDKESREVKIVFNEEVEMESEITGQLSITSEFSKEILTETTEQKIVFPFKDKPVTVEVGFKNNAGSTIDKEGISNKPMNADEIAWTVVFNKGEGTIADAVFSDQLPEGLSLDPGSIEIIPLTMKIDGTVKEKGAALDPSTYSVDTKAKPFTISFEEPKDINKAYQITYKTKIDKSVDAPNGYTNNAEVKGSNSVELQTSATVTSTKGKHLEKNPGVYSFNEGKQEVKWTVNYNYDEVVVPEGTVLTDTVTAPENIQADFDEDSFVVTVVDTTSGKPVATKTILQANVDYELVPTTDGFTVKWLKELKQAVTIDYKTTVKGQDGILDKDGKISNKITDGTLESGKDGNYTQGMLIKSNHRDESDFNKKTTPWSIVVNPNKYTLKNVVLKDIELGKKGLALLQDTLVIKKNNVILSKEIVAEMVGESVSQDGYTIDFGPEIKDTYTIEFTTKYTTEPIQDKYTNTANLTWEYNNGQKGSKDAAADFTPDTNSLNAGFKSGSYNAVTKKITWRIGINYNNHTLEAAVLSDPILDKQVIDLDSVKVYLGDASGAEDNPENGKVVPSEEYSVKLRDKDTDGNLLQNPILDVAFLSPIKEYRIVEFETFVGDQIIKSSYNNTAQLTNEGKDLGAKLTAKVSVQNGDKVATKEGKQDGEVINWTVNINDSQSKVEKAKLVDKPSNNQTFLRDSFELYGTTVSQDGTVTPDLKNKLVYGKDYTIEFEKDEESGQEGFVFEFTETINEPYVLKYQSYIVAGDQAKLTNTIGFEGENSEKIKQTTSKEVIVRFSEGDGSATGETGTLIVNKIDADTKKPLAGATFALVAKVKGVEKEIDRKVTDETGQVTFRRLLYKDYTLKEVKAPEGYVAAPDKIVKINSTTGVPVTVENHKKIHDVKLIKKDSVSGAKLEGAVFKLQQKIENDYQDVEGKTALTTDEVGQILVSKLPAGDYRFVETIAPSGYRILTQNKDFTIDENQIAVQELEIKNELILGSISLLKKDGTDNTIIPGATFKLVDAKGNTVGEPKTTDANGGITFDNLIPGNYHVIETEAATNYRLPVEGTLSSRVINVPLAVGGRSEAVPYEVTNDLIPRGIHLVKKDNVTKGVLAGAKFKLIDAENEDVQTETTNDSGELTFKAVRPGTYKVVEVEAPADYDLDPTEHEVIVPVSATENPTPVEIDLDNQITLGSIELHKVDRETRESLEGAVFELQDLERNPIQTQTTDNFGRLTFSNVRPGNYQIVETKQPDHYHLSEEVYPVTVDRSQKTIPVITAENDIILGSVKVIKTDAVTKKLLQGATYKLQTVVKNDPLGKGPIDATPKIIDIQSSNDQGVIEFNNVRPGDYEVVEVSAPTDYKIDTERFPVTVDASQKIIPTVEVSDPIVTGSIMIEKVDSETKEVLQGAEFSIKAVQNSMPDEDFVPFENHGTTDDKGQLIFTDLRPGDYEIQETKAPKDYELDPTIHTKTVDVSGEAKEIAIKTVTVENQIKKGSLEITKVDTETKAVLAGAEFALKNEAGEIVKEGTTDENGHLRFNDLRPGNYQLVETKSPNGYRVNDQELSVVIDRSQVEALQVTVENRFDVGSVILTKVDSKNKNKVLEKAVFTLYDVKGQVVQENLATDQLGEIQVDKLVPGSYYFVETKAPKGYQLSQAKITFEIEANSKEAVQVTVTNKAKPKNKKTKYLPKTGEQNNQVLTIIGLMMVVVLSFVWVFLNKKKLS